MSKVAAIVAQLALVALVFACTVEGTARIDDWLNSGTPLIAPASSPDDLTFHDGAITRGRPHAVHKKWRLNQFGFRGPEVALQPPAGACRVMVLGSSEAFGLYESRDCEFPAVAGRLLGDTGRYEVINAAITGMTLRSMLAYWHGWAKQFQPAIVIVYPAPQFYLNMVNRPQLAGVPARPAGPRAEPVQERWLQQLRSLDRARDVFELPAIIQRRINAKSLEEARSRQQAGWELAKLTPDYTAAFLDDLRAMVDAVRASGSVCVLVTHATRVAAPPGADDLPFLEAARVHVPRATAAVIAELEVEAAEAMRRYAAKEGIPLVDAARELGGEPGLFADLVHFTDAGAKAMAELLTAKVVSLSPREPCHNSTVDR